MKKKLINMIIGLTIITTIIPATITNAETLEKDISNKIENSAYMTNFPSRYDSRNYGYQSNVKNQKNIGCCWAFASCAAIEMNIKKNSGKSLDFSEIHLAQNNGIVQANEGGNSLVTGSYLTSWRGPVTESNAPYPTSGEVKDVKSSYDGTTLYHIQKMISIDESKTGNDRLDEIKRCVQKYGAMTVQVNSSYIDSYYGTIYNYGDSGIDHEITIVGWDNYYTKDSFKGLNKPKNNGAFICKNSWGEGKGFGGYFYLSYEDKNLLNPDNPMATFSEMESVNNYDHVYEGTTNTDTFDSYTVYLEGQNRIFPIKMNKIGENEEIKAVGIYSDRVDVDAELYYIDGNSDEAGLNAKLIENNKIKELHLDEAGFTTIKLDKPLIPKNKTNYQFYIKLKGTGKKAQNSEAHEIKKEYVDLLHPKINTSTSNKAKGVEKGISCIAGRVYTNNIKSNIEKNKETDDKNNNDDNKPQIKTGWVFEDDNWYFYNENGVMVSESWLTQNTKKYYVKDNGSMVIGWAKINGNWYYFNENGVMASESWLNQNNVWYYVTDNGSMITGWAKINGNWYYFNDKGAMASNSWLKDGGNWFYLKDNGIMAIGEYKVNGTMYYFNDNGTMK